MSKKIDATYVDNSKAFTDFKSIYIIIDEEDGYKIKIGRTVLTDIKVKEFTIDVVGLSRNVYLKIKTAKKLFEFRDIDFSHIEELRKFEKKQQLKVRKNSK